MLKLKLWRIENVVLMKVLEQDEELRGKLDYKATNGIEFYSRNNPEMSYGNLFVRGGDNKRDGDVCVEAFKNIKAAKGQIRKIQEAVKEFNQQYKPSTDDKFDDVEFDDIEVVIAE